MNADSEAFIQTMSQTYQFPRWVPSWKAWAMAIRLAVPAYAVASVALAIEVWRGCFLGLLLAFAGIEGLALGLAVSLLFLLLTLLWFLLWSAAYALLLRLLWSSPPKWLRLPAFATLVNRDFGILIAATLPVAVTCFVRFGLRLNSQLYSADFSSLSLSSEYRSFVLESFWLWFVAALFLYHSYYQVRANI